MSELYRFGVSLEKELIDEFDRNIRAKNYKNRSEAIRDLIRADLVKTQWQSNEEVAGAVTMIYDHHKRELLNKLTDIQHDFQNVIIAAQHVHIDHHNCIEIIAVKGRAKDIEELSNKLRAQMGVKHMALNMSSTGKMLK